MGCAQSKEKSSSMETTQTLHIAFAGPPGCGKGTLAERLHKEYGIVQISTGQLLREEIAKKSKVGLEVKELVEKGEYVADEYWLPLVKAKLEEDECKQKGWIIDGAPRNKAQVEAFKSYGIQPNRFVLFQVPDEIVMERIGGRRMDPETGKIYHLKYNPPPDEEIQKRLEIRADDSPEKCKSRLEIYSKNFVDVDTWYPKDIHVIVNANQPIDKVYEELKEKLGLKK